MSPAEVTEKLGLHRMRDRSWYVHPRYVLLVTYDPSRLITSTLNSVVPPLEKVSLKACNGFPKTSRSANHERHLSMTPHLFLRGALLIEFFFISFAFPLYPGSYVYLFFHYAHGPCTTPTRTHGQFTLP